jgi:hypothetical protein
MSQSTYIEIDHPWVRHELVPIYEWVFPVDVDDEQLKAFIKAREDWARVAHYPVAWVVQLSNLTKASASQLKLFSDHLKNFEEHDTRWNRGSALVFPSGPIRGIATAVLWMSPPTFPYRAFAERSDAVQWARNQLATAEGPA